MVGCSLSLCLLEFKLQFMGIEAAVQLTVNQRIATRCGHAWQAVAACADLAARHGWQRTEVHQFLRRPSLPPLESNTLAREDGTTVIAVVHRPPRQVSAHAFTELGVTCRLCKAGGIACFHADVLTCRACETVVLGAHGGRCDEANAV